MIRNTIKRLNLTDGERSILLAYLVVSLFGAGIAFTIVNQLGGNDSLLRKLSAYDLWMVFCGMAGASGGLFLGRRWMGRPGPEGLLQMLKGMGVISFVSAIIGGTLALPLYGTMFGPFLMVVTFWDSPMLAACWFATLFATHLLFWVWRGERDSIFRKLEEDDGIPV